MKSMTGYGSARLDSPAIKASIVAKSWNNRFLELAIQMPGYLGPLERRVRELVERRVARGKLELSVRVLGGEMPTDVVIDASSAKAVADAIRRLGQAAGIDEPVRLSHLLGVDGMLSYERNVDADLLWTALEPALNACLDEFDAEREREGAATRVDLEEKLATLGWALDVIEAAGPGIEAGLKAALRAKFEEVMGDLVDESRVLGELASYLAKHTINEEIVRLRSHMAAFRQAMGEPVCGKKLDFICQEMNREANTIGSKSADARVSDAVIRMKDAVENIREQARNVE
ncbi:MAG TPA: YicC family protein [Spirochaetales bacterium]|nr:YicC family protein [Spirochaetales bacterium]HPG86913.1 YicC family protein [Spirochaetales bacterium]